MTHVEWHPEGEAGLLFQGANSRRDLSQARERAGIDPVSPNDLRRTFVDLAPPATAWRLT